MENPPAQPSEPPHCIIPIHKPDIKELSFFFISGIVVSIPFALFFEQLSSFVPAIISVVLLAPVIEELAKVFPLFYRHGETERSIVNLGVLLGLGFGVSEFFLYVVLLDVPFIARVPGVIFHASSAAIVAFGIAKKNPLPYYLLAVALHLGNNFFAETNIVFGFIAELLVLIVTYLLAWQFYHKASKDKMVV
jgi:RsiW-degrading membrane proteinase PrsW (M82 family)